MSNYSALLSADYVNSIANAVCMLSEPDPTTPKRPRSTTPPPPTLKAEAVPVSGDDKTTVVVAKADVKDGVDDAGLQTSTHVDGADTLPNDNTVVLRITNDNTDVEEDVEKSPPIPVPSTAPPKPQERPPSPQSIPSYGGALPGNSRTAHNPLSASLSASRSIRAARVSMMAPSRNPASNPNLFNSPNAFSSSADQDDESSDNDSPSASEYEAEDSPEQSPTPAPPRARSQRIANAQASRPASTRSPVVRSRLRSREKRLKDAMLEREKNSPAKLGTLRSRRQAARKGMAKSSGGARNHPASDDNSIASVSDEDDDEPLYVPVQKEAPSQQQTAPVPQSEQKPVASSHPRAKPILPRPEPTVERDEVQPVFKAKRAAAKTGSNSKKVDHFGESEWDDDLPIAQRLRTAFPKRYACYQQDRIAKTCQARNEHATISTPSRKKKRAMEKSVKQEKEPVLRKSESDKGSLRRQTKSHGSSAEIQPEKVDVQADASSVRTSNLLSYGSQEKQCTTLGWNNMQLDAKQEALITFAMGQKQRPRGIESSKDGEISPEDGPPSSKDNANKDSEYQRMQLRALTASSRLRESAGLPVHEAKGVPASKGSINNIIEQGTVVYPSRPAMNHPQSHAQPQTQPPLLGRSSIHARSHPQPLEPDTQSPAPIKQSAPSLPLPPTKIERPELSIGMSGALALQPSETHDDPQQQRLPPPPIHQSNPERIPMPTKFLLADKPFPTTLPLPPGFPHTHTHLPRPVDRYVAPGSNSSPVGLPRLQSIANFVPPPTPGRIAPNPQISSSDRHLQDFVQQRHDIEDHNKKRPSPQTVVGGSSHIVEMSPGPPIPSEPISDRRPRNEVDVASLGLLPTLKKRRRKMALADIRTIPMQVPPNAAPALVNPAPIRNSYAEPFMRKVGVEAGPVAMHPDSRVRGPPPPYMGQIQQFAPPPQHLLFKGPHPPLQINDAQGRPLPDGGPALSYGRSDMHPTPGLPSALPMPRRGPPPLGEKMMSGPSPAARLAPMGVGPPPERLMPPLPRNPLHPPHYPEWRRGPVEMINTRTDLPLAPGRREPFEMPHPGSNESVGNLRMEMNAPGAVHMGGEARITKQESYGRRGDQDRRSKRTIMPYLPTAERRAQYEQGRALAFINRAHLQDGGEGRVRTDDGGGLGMAPLRGRVGSDGVGGGRDSRRESLDSLNGGGGRRMELGGEMHALGGGLPHGVGGPEEFGGGNMGRSDPLVPIVQQLSDRRRLEKHNDMKNMFDGGNGAGPVGMGVDGHWGNREEDVDLGKSCLSQMRGPGVSGAVPIAPGPGMGRSNYGQGDIGGIGMGHGMGGHLSGYGGGSGVQSGREKAGGSTIVADEASGRAAERLANVPLLARLDKAGLNGGDESEVQSGSGSGSGSQQLPSLRSHPSLRHLLS